MSLDLTSLAPVPAIQGSLTVLLGTPGSGKTTCASTWPGPRVASTLESGSELLGPETRALPAVKSASDVLNQLRELARQRHEFRSYVLDSWTALQHVERARLTEGGGSMETACGGYGRAYQVVADELALLVPALRFLARERSMNVVVTAHVDVRTVDLPDRPSYREYVPRGLAKTERRQGSETAALIEAADVVALIERGSQIVDLGGDGQRVTASADGQWFFDVDTVVAPTKSRFAWLDGRRTWTPDAWPLEVTQ
ncbi:MAG: AAA family ATPase [Alphaproteobacteria bacterium]|nr:AAA family ATPase [Alphaproteobacteria bacterium]